MRHVYRRFGRFQLIELHEQKWCPAVFRDALTEWLRVMWERSRAVRVVAPLIEEAVRQSGATKIVDLCSGASGPVVPLQQQMARDGMQLPVLLTDKFPNAQVMATIEGDTGGTVTGCRESMDATALPGTLHGFRTLFNSFHHFRPEQAHAILADAYRNRQPIGIFEITEPKLIKILLSFPFSFVSTFVLILWMRPSRLVWWFFTWMIPIIPFVIAWDGLVSHLRSYTPNELMDLTRGISDDSFRWSVGSIGTRAGMDVGYLIGIPVNHPK